MSSLRAAVLCCWAIVALGLRSYTSTPPPDVPNCGEISGAVSFAFSRDGGKTLVGPRSDLELHSYADEGVAIIPAIPALMIIEGDRFLASTDGGCYWSPTSVQATIPSPSSSGSVRVRDLNIVAAGPATAYAVKRNSDLLVMLDASHVKSVVKSPVEIAALAVDSDEKHLKLIGADATDVWDSYDGGIHWQRIGQLRSKLPSGYNAGAFANHASHIVLALVIEGVWTSTDGGSRWSQARGIPADDSIHYVAISAADDRVVWAGDSRGTFYRSTDGGSSFARFRVDAGPIRAFAADPRDSNVLYFADDRGFLYRYDVRTGRPSRQRIEFAKRDLPAFVSAIAFSPADSSLMYFRLSRSGPMTIR